MRLLAARHPVISHRGNRSQRRKTDGRHADRALHCHRSYRRCRHGREFLTFPRGVPRQVWRHALHRRYRLLASSAIVREVARVLREDFHWEEIRLRRRLKLLVRIGEMVTPQTTLHVITNDPDDNRILVVFW